MKPLGIIFAVLWIAIMSIVVAVAGSTEGTGGAIGFIGFALAGFFISSYFSWTSEKLVEARSERHFKNNNIWR